jgi:hypothetical protein
MNMATFLFYEFMLARKSCLILFQTPRSFYLRFDSVNSSFLITTLIIVNTLPSSRDPNKAVSLQGFLQSRYEIKPKLE